MTKQIESKLSQYADLQDQAQLINLDFEAKKMEAMPPEVQQLIEDIEAERREALEAIEQGAADLKAEIANAVKDHGATVKGEYYQAVYSLRSTWNGKKLEGYAAAHPEILAFRKQSSSVALRQVNR